MADVERESLEVDVLFVGAGPATLVSALHLSRQVAAHNAKAEKSGGKTIEPPTILVIEKSASLGDHSLSGAVINPKAIAELMPDFMEQGFPTEYVCDDASFYMFFRSFTIKSPICPPNFQKTGYHVVSLSNVVKWLGTKCEEAGIEIYPGFAGDQLLVEGNRVVGVRIGDMGVDKNGKPKANYQPGMDIFAKVTVLGEGVRGSLTKQLIDRFELQGRYPQVYETGVKEIWRVKPEKHKPGRVIHGSLFPDFLSQFNGMWLYDMKDNLVSFGFVTMLDSKNPFNDPHLEAQKFKTTPFMRDLLDGAELVRYGAKALPVSGIYAQPKLYCDGAMLVGDAASMCNAFRARRHPPRDEVGNAGRGDDRRRARLGRLLRRDARRLRGALPQQLGLRGAHGGAQLPRLHRGEPDLRARSQHPADADHQGPRALRPAALQRRPHAHEEALRAARGQADEGRSSSSTTS